MFSGWQNIPQHIDPVFLTVGPLQVHWYGLMYLVAFLIVYSLAVYRIKTEHLAFSTQVVGDFLTLAVAAVLIGGRLGYVLFYNFSYYLAHPLAVISPFEFSDGWHYVGIYGMSYHGALLAVIFCFFYFTRRNSLAVWRFIDLFVPAVPLGYMFGRIGNFINGELYGRVTSVPWGMYFPLDALHQLRHPSQLYEAAFEGLFLFAVFWSLRRIKAFDGFLAALYLIGYGTVRFLIEFTREPDPQLGFVLGPLTMGQLLCMGMVAAGIGIFILQRKHKGT